MKKAILLHALSIIGCLGACILLCAAQTSFLPHYLNDAFLVPDLLLCLTVGIGILAGSANAAYGGIYGALLGIFAGVLADSTGGFGIFLLPLFYMLCGYGASVCVQLIPNRNFPVYAVVGVAGAALRTVVAVIYVFLCGGNVPLLDIARYVCIPLMLGTCLALPVMYPAAWLLTLPVRKIKHQTIDKII